jgi:phosphatidylglycerophosphate synthase
MNLWIDASGLPRAHSLFGLAPLERLRRSERKVVGAGSTVFISGAAQPKVHWPDADHEVDTAPLGTRLRRALGAGAPLLVVDAATVVDPRLFGFLDGIAGPCVAARGAGAERAVMLKIDASTAAAIPPDAKDVVAVADALLAAGLAAPVDEEAFPAFVDKLRRSLPYWIYRVNDSAARRRLERQMFRDNYKGSTDLLTSHVYPPLVWPTVRLCARLGIHPNVVTVISVLLAFAAVPLFASGDWLAGFACAYGMSVLDSVDGKIARLTLTDSRLGNLLDHGLDLVHPPFWYFAWAWGMGAHHPGDALYQMALWLIGFYFADRIVLGIARKRLGHGLHATTPLDERVRSIIARRNITMTIMAVALAVGVGTTGFLIVTVWQGLTVAWHSWRTLWLGFLRPVRRRGEA